MPFFQQPNTHSAAKALIKIFRKNVDNGTRLLEQLLENQQHNILANARKILDKQVLDMNVELAKFDVTPKLRLCLDFLKKTREGGMSADELGAFDSEIMAHACQLLSLLEDINLMRDIKNMIEICESTHRLNEALKLKSASTCTIV